MLEHDFTLDRAETLVRECEQLSVSLQLVHEQDLSTEQYIALQPMTCVLLSKLIDDLQTAVTVIGVYRFQIEEGGMGEAPMVDALDS